MLKIPVMSAQMRNMRMEVLRCVLDALRCGALVSSAVELIRLERYAPLCPISELRELATEICPGVKLPAAAPWLAVEQQTRELLDALYQHEGAISVPYSMFVQASADLSKSLYLLLERDTHGGYRVVTTDKLESNWPSEPLPSFGIITGRARRLAVAHAFWRSLCNEYCVLRKSLPFRNIDLSGNTPLSTRDVRALDMEDGVVICFGTRRVLYSSKC